MSDPVPIVAFLNARTCISDGCERTGKLTRGMCAKCYRYWLDHTPREQHGAAPRFSRQFWDFVEKTHEHGCWVWKGTALPDGRGVWTENYVSIMAPRHSWTLANGEIPEDLWVLHYCDMPACVNPRHLYLGTITENTIDAVTRGRNHHPPLHTHCSEGHELAGDNLRVINRTNGRPIRTCRICDNARSRQKQREIRARRRSCA